MPSIPTVNGVESHHEALLCNALQAATDKFSKCNPKSFELDSEAQNYLPGGNTRTVLHTLPFPITFASGDSCYLTSVDGDKYLDSPGEYTAGIYGHNHPVIQQAIKDAMATGWNYGGVSKNEKILARMVCERFHLEMVRFTNSGTEANMMAIATAMNYTGRKKTVVFSNGYHGSTLSFPDPLPKNTVNLPHDFVIAPFNDSMATQMILSGLENESLAAILVEPVQGSAGAIEGQADFLQYLRQTATDLGAVLILDEVMTSRLAYHGLGAKLGIKADLMTLGKWIGGGMSFGAFGGHRDIMAMFDQKSGSVSHSGTFNNNVFSMAAGVAGCRLMDEQAIQSLNERGEEMKAKIEAVLRKHAVTTSKRRNEIEHRSGYNEVSHTILHGKPRMYVRGVGSMLAIHISRRDQTLLRGLLFHHMLQEGIYIAPRGFIALCIDISRAHVDVFVAALDRFVVTFLTALAL